MTQISNQYVEKMDVKESGMRAKVIRDGQNTTVVWAGPWLKDKEGNPIWFDDRTECQFANTNFKRIKTNEEHGLNAQGQTPDQEKSFNAKKKETEVKKRKAEMAAEMALQNK